MTSKQNKKICQCGATPRSGGDLCSQCVRKMSKPCKHEGCTLTCKGEYCRHHGFKGKPCEYVKRDGTLCGKPSRSGTCATHHENAINRRRANVVYDANKAALKRREARIFALQQQIEEIVHRPPNIKKYDYSRS